MTVVYINKVATTKFWQFLKILFIWKGSIYKMVWFELLIFGSLYSLLSLIYRYGLKGDDKIMFEKFCIYCKKAVSFMPIAFILSFYVTMIANRWWNQFKNIPWPDSIGLYVNACMSNDPNNINVKRSMLKYVNISLMLFLRSISPRIKRKFPIEETIKDVNLMNWEEFSRYQKLGDNCNKYFLPLLWAGNLAKKAFKEKYIKTELRYLTIIQEINQFRQQLHTLFCYDWVNPPLVYTQTASVAVYTFCITNLISNQFLEPEKNYEDHEIDLYIPIFTIIQMVFYFGWLKVAETLINPFGEDDDDFDCLGLIERNLTASLLFTEHNDLSHPELKKDMRWAEEIPLDIISTIDDKNFMKGSLMHLNMR